MAFPSRASWLLPVRTPKALESLVHEGVIQEVIRPLMSGKEAQVYLVVADDRYCAAKIYKDAQQRSFKNRADYTEGRKVRNSRDQRAMAKGTKYGKGRDEDAWKHTEVDMIYRLRAAGVRVPEPYMYIDGVLLMELVMGPDGHPAPRLGDLEFTADEALEIYDWLIRETARMLPAGIVHGDLSEFNILMAADGPVIIDFPQSVNAAGNHNAKALFLRDVGNLFRFLRRWVPTARRRPYGEEMWELFEKNELTPETQLTGRVSRKAGPVDTSEVLSLIGDANRDEADRRRAAGQSTEGVESSTPMRRREVIVEKPQPRGRPGAGRGRPGERPDAGPGRRGAAGGRPGGRSGGSPRGRSEDPGRRAARPSNSRPDDGRRKNSGPKRGDAVKASSYVSPEARKTKVMTLTPRDESGAPKKERTEPNGEAAAARKKRRRRRPRGGGAEGGSREAKSPQANNSDAPRRRRNRR